MFSKNSDKYEITDLFFVISHIQNDIKYAKLLDAELFEFARFEQIQTGEKDNNIEE